MGETTGIAWTDHTFNPVIGCSKVSDGCKNCYAEAQDHRWGHDSWGPGKPRRRTSIANWQLPLKWSAAASKAGVRSRVFCASLADVFDSEWDPAIRYDLWNLIGKTPWLDWQLLTKRPENIRPMLPSSIPAGLYPDTSRVWPWPNVWIGTSVENQETADKRIPELMDIPAKVRFLSCEPLLGPVDLRSWFNRWAVRGPERMEPAGCIHWVIVGGESGPKAREMRIEWARDLVGQCASAGVACFFKQLGARASDEVNGIAGHSLKVHPDAAALISRRLVDRKGGDPSEWPADLRIREFPR